MSELKVDKVTPRSGTTVTLGDSGDSVAIPTGVGFNGFGFRNKIINGDFSIAQRGTSFTSGANDDDAYTLDRWYILSDGNDAIDVTQETTTVPTNQLTAIALDVETADKKFGIAQIIEQKNCVGLIGNTVTLSFKAKVSATTDLDNVKCAIVAWDGTADTVTSDIISAWGAEGTNPTLIANATYENTPANLNVTTSYATYSVTANVDTASTKNIIVFIWSDVTTVATGNFLYITDVQLEAGTTASDFEFLPYDVNLQRCQRYYQKSLAGAGGSNSGGGQVAFILPLQPDMRAQPSATLINGTSVLEDFYTDRRNVTPGGTFHSGNARGRGILVNATTTGNKVHGLFGEAYAFSAEL